jgi:glycosyltransferase involved in cell wall biosynthesis
MSLKKPSRIWRQWNGDARDLAVSGVTLHVTTGAYLESEAFRLIVGPDRKRLGETLQDVQLQKRIGHMPAPGQMMVDGDAPRVSSRPPVVSVEPVARSSAVAALLVRMGLGDELPPSAEFAIVAGADTDLPSSAIAECVRLLQREPGLDVAIPLHNIGSPICAPQSRDAASSGALRLPAGRSPKTIADALLALPFAHTATTPDEFGCAVVRRSAWEAWCAGTVPREKAATCLTAFAWRRVGSESLRGLVAQSGAAAATAHLIQPVREAVAKVGNAGPKVLFVSGGVGPVGGTQVVLNLVDALNDIGIAASFAHLHTGSMAHKFRCKSTPLALTQAELARDIEDRLGWTRGEPAVVIATSFASGRVSSAICAGRPHFIPAAFWQDREDLFERPDGRKPSAGEFVDFLAIPRGVCVSRWVADAAPEIGGPRGMTVINPTVDPDFLASEDRQKNGRKTAEDAEEGLGRLRKAVKSGTSATVRILAMWRPMTAVRRGMPLLAETYRRLHEKYGAAVSLEIFGWDEGAPKFCRSHGHLDTRGVAALMREVDVVVEPSAAQGYGLAGLEGLASGATVVSTACKGPAEYLRHEVNGLMVPHADLFDAICRVVDGWRAPERTVVETWADVAGRWAGVIRGWVDSTRVGG